MTQSEEGIISALVHTRQSRQSPKAMPLFSHRKKRGRSLEASPREGREQRTVLVVLLECRVDRPCKVQKLPRYISKRGQKTKKEHATREPGTTGMRAHQVPRVFRDGAAALLGQEADPHREVFVRERRSRVERDQEVPQLLRDLEFYQGWRPLSRQLRKLVQT